MVKVAEANDAKRRQIVLDSILTLVAGTLRQKDWSVSGPDDESLYTVSMKTGRLRSLILNVDRQLHIQQDVGPRCLVEERGKNTAVTPYSLTPG